MDVDIVKESSPILVAELSTRDRILVKDRTHFLFDVNVPQVKVNE